MAYICRLMRSRILLCLMLLILSGCATYTGIGSETWYGQRMAELETARKENKITEAEYLTYKNQLDQMRIDYIDDDCGPQTHFGFGYWH